MSNCTKETCGECIPLYRYYINQQPALVNAEQVISIDCPPGYLCERPNVEIHIESGRKRVIPDLPPTDQDNDPECSYECEVNDVPVDPNENGGLGPRRVAQNTEQTAYCSDLGFGDDQTGPSRTVAAGTFTVEYNGVTRTQAQAQAIADALAKQVAVAQLQAAITAGEETCGNWLFGNRGQSQNVQFDLTGPGGTITIRWTTIADEGGGGGG